ncbi:MAG: hypothetical protein CMH63_01300 [Nanoarchaeota archaeon]|jgi:hypothetical protein|nr:hypothetical protein [Nanoarchaeota archaeon]|tara:strand:+ start:42770 stop:42949 length:180 start_codon:yes stop_codon:yes gene_type:complete
MAEEVKTEVPSNLSGYKLERSGGGMIKKLIILIIIIIVILWFVKRDILIDVWNWILSFF